jgi:hypothetical protein
MIRSVPKERPRPAVEKQFAGLEKEQQPPQNRREPRPERVQEPIVDPLSPVNW